MCFRLRKGFLLILVCVLFFPPSLPAQALKKSPSQGELESQRVEAIEKFEKEKLERMRKNVGKWFIIVKPDAALEFFDDPRSARKKIRVKEKETFLVLEVLQNDAGDMNFYKTKMDSGRIVYLSADALYLELKVREGSIAAVLKGPGSRNWPGGSRR